MRHLPPDVGAIWVGAGPLAAELQADIDARGLSERFLLVGARELALDGEVLLGVITTMDLSRLLAEGRATATA